MTSRAISSTTSRQTIARLSSQSQTWKLKPRTGSTVFSIFLRTLNRLVQRGVSVRMQGLKINLVSDTIDPNSHSQTCCVLPDGSQSKVELKVQIWFLSYRNHTLLVYQSTSVCDILLEPQDVNSVPLVLQHMLLTSVSVRLEYTLAGALLVKYFHIVDVQELLVAAGGKTRQTDVIVDCNIICTGSGSPPIPSVQDMYTRLLSANLDFDSELQHVSCWEPYECGDSRVSHVDRVFLRLCWTLFLVSVLGTSNVARGWQFLTRTHVFLDTVCCSLRKCWHPSIEKCSQVSCCTVSAMWCVFFPVSSQWRVFYAFL